VIFAFVLTRFQGFNAMYHRKAHYSRFPPQYVTMIRPFSFFQSAFTSPYTVPY
jgi:hypothetical protein